MITLSLLALLTINSILANEFDTYNEECPRIRRNWDLLSKEEKMLYIEGLMKLRENGNGNLLQDELVAIASVYQQYGSFHHKASTYFFLYSYLLWELESRIRNLGDKWKCFAIPYWDFTTDPSLIFNNEENGLGGFGDPDNEWKVNKYSWDYSTEQYWVPTHCTAEGDEFPICSLKRAKSDTFTWKTAEEFGDGIINNPTFKEFTRWYYHVENTEEAMDPGIN